MVDLIIELFKRNADIVFANFVFMMFYLYHRFKHHFIYKYEKFTDYLDFETHFLVRSFLFGYQLMLIICLIILPISFIGGFIKYYINHA